ncbi:MAG: dienelactone hydrolase family protein [Planctomycetota bacterium]|nr:dienelactone hydrolase family protein [Planctomycetota bacterium]
MPSSFPLIALLALTLVACFAAPAAGAIRTEKVEYTHGGVKLVGFAAWDDAVPGRRPGVLIVHEWWGLNDYVKRRAQDIARLGYFAFAVDMYGEGTTVTSPEDAARLMTSVRGDVTLWRERAAAGLAAMNARPEVDPALTGAMGYCFGGSTALELARAGADLDAVVSFHGGLSTQSPAQPGTVRASILVCDGADDPFLTVDERPNFIKEMQKAKADYVFIGYSGAVHAFTNPDVDARNIDGARYNKAADERSWRHMKDFFREKFGR